jgi:hypothetical protein
MSRIFKILSNIPGWSTNRKIVVLESDDWGGIRMPSAEAFNTLKDVGLDIVNGDSFRYNKYDTLETAKDLQNLYGVLSGVKDSNGKSAVFTAICVVANPDFEKIKKSNFQFYFYEAFTDTLKKYGNRDNVVNLMKEGIESRTFIPQFHGREHLNVPAWMRALQNNDELTHLAFRNGFWGYNNSNPFGVQYQAAFDLEYASDVNIQKDIITDGLMLFRELFGYAATYFVPPNGPFNNSLETVAARMGIKYMAASKIQYEPLGEGKVRRVFHYIGQRNKQRQTYITRNCSFEPSQSGKNWIDSCLSDIELSFLCKKPAVISTHRVNYIGAICVKNRDSGLEQLQKLLKSIVNKWPQVEFLTSSELGELINAE